MGNYIDFISNIWLDNKGEYDMLKVLNNDFFFPFRKSFSNLEKENENGFQEIIFPFFFFFWCKKSILLYWFSADYWIENHH